MGDQLPSVLGALVLGSPAALAIVLGLPALFGRPLTERLTNRLTYVSTVTGLLSAIGVVVMMLVMDSRHLVIDLGDWVVIPGQHFTFHLKFVFDRLSAPFVVLSFLLCGTVSAFASRYLHREPGFGRFSVCYALFLLGMVVSALAGAIEVLFFGWELVGLSSAILVAFFHERMAPVQNGFRVWSVYRLADAAFLLAAVAMHHMIGAGDFDGMIGAGDWPLGVSKLTSGQALQVGLLLLAAAAGKSALIPFSGWLPRAMEGPTPSSAVFYGALSVHLGAFLLLRTSPLLDASLMLSAAVAIVGVATAIYAATTARVQTDIKSALAFASLTQVGVIVAEIGLGFRYVALVHIIGHACLRTLQLLRAPSLLRDHHALENAIGRRLSHEPGPCRGWIPQSVHERWYRFALHRGYLDGLLDEYVVNPLVRTFRWCDAAERRWTGWLSGGSPPPPNVQSHSEIMEELRL
ncbi:MAG TPA: proton-conducting transporter membrane subunit [Lacipirellulaceae bacterium]|nr:proton-conducting transporter membrane subunit [Lacipirellulaceae bacterium]